MSEAVPPECSGVLEKQQSAEEWRLLGEKLRKLNRPLYDRLFSMLVMSIPDDDHTDITKSYFLT